MSSRVWTAKGPASVEPISWRRVAQVFHASGAVSPLAGEPGQASPHSEVEQLQCRLRALEQQSETRIREAREAGLREGEAAAKARAVAELEPLRQQLARTIEELAALRPRLQGDAERDLVRLSVAIARRILRRELTVDPEAIHGLMRAALDRLQGQTIARVRIHPALESPLRAYLSQSPVAREIELFPDQLLDPGGVVFETSRGNLDASMETQLREIERGLTDRIGRSPRE